MLSLDNQEYTAIGDCELRIEDHMKIVGKFQAIPQQSTGQINVVKSTRLLLILNAHLMESCQFANKMYGVNEKNQALNVSFV
jgi:hypothetical protein